MHFPGKHRVLALGFVLIGTAWAGHAQDAKPVATPIPAAPPIRLPSSRLVPDAVIALGGDRQLAVTPDGVWVSDRAAGTVVRIDPKTNAIEIEKDKSLPIGKEPCTALVFAFKSLWTAGCASGTLVRLTLPAITPAATPSPSATMPQPTAAPAAAAKPDKDPLTEIKVAVRGPGPLVSATGSVWMLTDVGRSLIRVDPDTNTVVADVTLPAAGNGIAVSGDAIWIVSTRGAQATRVNGYSNVVEEIVKVGPAPIAIASGEGSVWTLNGGDGTVSRIDPKTAKVTETIKAGVTAVSGTIAAGEGSVWISAPGIPLSRIDPRTNRLAQQFSGPGGGALAIGLKSLWLTASPSEIWRLDPRRVEATRK